MRQLQQRAPRVKPPRLIQLGLAPLSLEVIKPHAASRADDGVIMSRWMKAKHGVCLTPEAPRHLGALLIGVEVIGEHQHSHGQLIESLEG